MVEYFCYYIDDMILLSFLYVIILFFMFKDIKRILNVM